MELPRAVRTGRQEDEISNSAVPKIHQAGRWCGGSLASGGSGAAEHAASCRPALGRERTDREAIRRSDPRRRMRLINFAMAYFDGCLVIRGAISKAVDVLDAINLATDQRQTVAEFCWWLLIRSLKVLIPNYARRFESLDHYSQSARAYELFLDDNMQYTCGRSDTGKENLNEAQLAKFHLIKRLVTKYTGPPTGKDHLDIGCGWGGMGA